MGHRSNFISLVKIGYCPQETMTPVNDHLDLSGQWERRIAGRCVDFVTVPGGYPPLGQCQLIRTFAWHATTPRQPSRVFLVTEGVLASARFILNGHDLGIAGPWATYRFEISPGLLREHNLLEAHIRDIPESFGPTPGRRFDAGLVRSLWIERRPATFLDSIAFTAALNPDCTHADCTVAIELEGSDRPSARVVLAEKDTGRVVAEAQASVGQPARFAVNAPQLWSPERPDLYHLSVTLAGSTADQLCENVGFRRIEIRGQDFFLNNRRLVLKGVCRHEFTDAGGYSPSEGEVRRELAHIRHAGFNYVRLVHSPQAPCVCRIAAELGLLVSEEPGTCFHDLADEAVAAPALECLARTVKRDRNVPSVLAWLIYNECNPDSNYAIRAARTIRQLDPSRFLSFADCSGRDAEIKAMVDAAGLSFYGINVYSYWPHDYTRRMEIFADRPLLFTEWGGFMGQGNPRALKALCNTFALHSRPEQSLRLAGCTFWVWADYEEHSRPQPAALDGWTTEGLVDAAGRPKPDLQVLSSMCFDIDCPPLLAEPRPEVLLPGPQRDESWRPICLESVHTAQDSIEKIVDDTRLKQLSQWEPLQSRGTAPLPRLGRLLVDGIEFLCRDVTGPAHPLMLGAAQSELVLPVGRVVDAIAVLGNVAWQGGYPASGIWSVHHRDAEAAKQFASPAAEYVLVFDDGQETLPLRHGLEILRANDICRWWTPAPRAPHTRPAVRAVVNPTFEVLRLDLWHLPLRAPRRLREIRWRLSDADSILLLYALSVRAIN